MTTYVNEKYCGWDYSLRNESLEKQCTYYTREYIMLKTVYFNQNGLIEKIIFTSKPIKQKPKSVEMDVFTVLILK